MQLIYEALHLSYREIWAFEKAAQIFLDFFKGDFPPKRFFSGLMVIIQMFSFMLFQTPMPATGQELDLTGYELVFCDNFDGDTLNEDVWFHRGVGARRTGYNASSQAVVKDGNLVITGEYLENGTYGEGWYAGAVALKEKYKQGYFEISCICNDGLGYWSAFWIQADSPYTPEISKGGIGGAELDIFESRNSSEEFLRMPAVTHAIHCSGMEGDTSGGLNSVNLGTFTGKNIFKDYNTYGLEWTEDEYIFYINGVETTRSAFADGVSQVPEQVILSLEIPEDMSAVDKAQVSEFKVDYIKIYQKG